MVRKLDDFLDRKLFAPLVGAGLQNQTADFVRLRRFGFDEHFRRFKIGKPRPIGNFAQGFQKPRVNAFRLFRLQKPDENRVDQIFPKLRVICRKPRRLKNDDKIFLLSKENARLNLDTVIKFHEPTALLILDSILPKELPPPVSLDEKASDAGARELDESDLIHTSRVPVAPVKSPRRGNIFGYFTITEIIIMAIGTLITAAVIFLILELY